MKTMIIAFALLTLMTPMFQGPTYPPQLHYYDAQVKVLLPHLEDFQTEYHDLTGRYYQALSSHTTPPEVPTPPDHLSGKPTDQEEDLAYFWTPKAHLPDVLAWAMEINTYRGPDGDGYVLVVSTMLDNEIWQMAVNDGPEAWRSYDWKKLETAPLELLEELKQ